MKFEISFVHFFSSNSILILIQIAADSLRVKSANRGNGNRVLNQPLDDIWSVAESDVIPINFPTNPLDYVPSESPGFSKKTNKPKKKVTWPKDDSKLEAVREFSKDEEEIPNAVEIEKNLGDFSNVERAHMHNVTNVNPSQEIPLSFKPYKAPRVMELPIECVVKRGEMSKQVGIQNERESKELAPSYWHFAHSKIPENPTEAPAESDYDDSKTKIIPFEDTSQIVNNVVAPLLNPNAYLVS